MQSNSQEHRLDVTLEKAFVYKIGNNKWFIDSNWNHVLDTDQYKVLTNFEETSFLKDWYRSYVQLYDMGSIPYFANFKLNAAEVDFLNKEGLDIFLSEQIIHTNYEKTDFILNGINNTEVTGKSKDWWSPELDSVVEFINLNNLKKVIVHVGFEDTLETYKNVYNFQIKRNDVALDALKNQMLGKDCDFIPALIDKKFWCANFRYEPHRHIITAFLSKLDTEYSWFFTDPEHKVLENIWFNINDLKHKHEVIDGIYFLNENCKGIDYNAGITEIAGNEYDRVLRPGMTDPAGPKLTEYTNANLYKNTFCSVINYSTFAEPFPSYDEKVLSAMINQRPFVFCGPPGSLALMRKDGFLTFGDFWDESYDQEWDHTKRLEMIFDLLLEINSWPIDRCISTYDAMLKVIFHNYMKIKDGE